MDHEECMGNFMIKNVDDPVIETFTAVTGTNPGSLEAKVRDALSQHASRRTRLAKFRRRTRRLTDTVAGVNQTDSVELLHEDRNRGI